MSRLYSQRNRNKQKRKIEDLEALKIGLEIEKTSLLLLRQNYQEQLHAAMAENQVLRDTRRRQMNFQHEAAIDRYRSDNIFHHPSIMQLPLSPFAHRSIQLPMFGPLLGTPSPSRTPMMITGVNAPPTVRGFHNTPQPPFMMERPAPPLHEPNVGFFPVPRQSLTSLKMEVGRQSNERLSSDSSVVATLRRRRASRARVVQPHENPPSRRRSDDHDDGASKKSST
jgi:hypothetical protein